MKKRILSLVVLVIALATFLTVGVSAADILDEGTCGKNVEWTVDSDGVLTVSGTGAMTDYNSVAYVPWYSSISSIKTIMIEDGVTSIGNYAFDNCRALTEVTIPASVTSIGDYAFYCCEALDSVAIPDSVTSIGDYAFYVCDVLTEVSLGTGVETIGDYAFYYCSSLNEVTIPASVTSIGRGAFSGCSSLSEITFKGDAPVIASGAFRNCYATCTYPNQNSTWDSIVADEEQYGNLIWVMEPCADGEHIWGDATCTHPKTCSVCGAIEGSVLPHNYVGGSCVDCGAADPDAIFGTCGTDLTWVLCDGVLTISGAGAIPDYNSTDAPWYEYRASVESVVIGEKVTSIGSYAFYFCEALTEVTIPASVTSIGGHAFYYCKALTEVTIPASVTSIGDFAFYNCSTLTEVAIPASVTSIGSGAFYNCSALAEAAIPDSVETLGTAMFRSCTSLERVILPAGLTQLPESLFYDCDSLTDLTLPAGLTQLPATLFYDCDSLTGVTIPEGVTVIGEKAFYACEKLENIVLPKQLTKIDTYAFYGCTGLTGTLILSDGLEQIRSYAFSGCTGLTGTLRLPDGLKFIDNYAFSGCTGLNEIEFPEHQIVLYYGAFSGCSSVKVIEFMGEAPTCNDQSNYIPFDGVTAECRIDLSRSGWSGGLMEALGGDLAWTYCGDPAGPCGDLVWTLNDEGTMTLMGTGGMDHYSFTADLPWRDHVKKVVFPAGMTYVGGYSFYDCDKLTSVEIPEGARIICSDAFRDCDALTTVVLPRSLQTIQGWSFRYCDRLSKVSYAGTMEEWASIDIEEKTGLPSPGYYGYFGFISHPADFTAGEGIDARFSVGAVGTGLSYQWQYRTSADGTWLDVEEGGTSFDLIVTTSAEKDGYQYRCKITDQDDRGAYSDAAALTVLPAAIIVQPESVKAEEGSTAEFYVFASGTGLSYQWQYCTPNTDWRNVDGEVFNSLVVDTAADKNGWQYRCMITNEYGNKICTSTATLAVTTLKITAQPESVSIDAGKTARFTVSASGIDLSYQWLYRTSSAGEWSNMPGTSALTEQLRVVADLDRNGHQYRCRITDGGGEIAYTDVVTLSVLSPAVSVQPVTVTVGEGETAEFSLKALGYGLTYQWEYMDPADGIWINAEDMGADTNVLSITAAAALDGYQYRCRVSDTTGKYVYSNAVTLNVGIPLRLSVQPNESVGGIQGEIVEFAVQAQGKELSYQWQYRKAGASSWSQNWSSSLAPELMACAPQGITSAVLQLTADQSIAGYQFMCKVYNADEKVFSDPATLVIVDTPAKPNKIVNTVSGVHVYWNGVDGAEKYGVWRSETGKSGTYKWLGNPSALHFTDKNVESGKTYHYKVTAVANGMHTQKSDSMGIIFVATPDITLRVNRAVGIGLGWDEIQGASGYAIYRKSYYGSDPWVRVATIKDPETLTWNDTSVKNSNGSVYKYTIRALAGSDLGTMSGSRNGRTMVRLTSRALNSAVKVGDNAIKCIWTTTAQATGYEVRFMVGNSVYKTFTIGNYKTGTKTFSGLPSGQEYKIQVRAYKKVDDVGSFYSAWSTAEYVQL